jgi:hypothetical protein
MDRFSIPDRLEPVAPTESTRRQSFTSDQRRRRDQSPPQPPKAKDDDSAPFQDGEDSHNVDEVV